MSPSQDLLQRLADSSSVQHFTALFRFLASKLIAALRFSGLGAYELARWSLKLFAVCSSGNSDMKAGEFFGSLKLAWCVRYLKSHRSHEPHFPLQRLSWQKFSGKYSLIIPLHIQYQTAERIGVIRS